MFGKTKVQGDLTAKKIMPKGGTQAKSKIGGSRRGEARDKAAARRKFKVPAPAGWVCKTNQEIDEAADNEVVATKYASNEVDIETDGYYTYNMEQPVHVLDSEVKKVIGMLKLGPDYQTEPDRVEKEHSLSAPRICLGLPSHPQ